MSRWSVAHVDDPLDAFVDDADRQSATAGTAVFVADAGTNTPYLLATAPPTRGVSAPKMAGDILHARVTRGWVGRDVVGESVTWYDVSSSTASYQWAVCKRFSDFCTLDASLRRMRLHRLTPSTKMAFPSLPSKVSLGRWTNRFVEQRRCRLDAYLESVLRFMRLLTLAAAGAEGGLTPVARASFAALMEFLTQPSASDGDPLYGMAEGSPSSRDSHSGAPSSRRPPPPTVSVHSGSGSLDQGRSSDPRIPTGAAGRRVWPGAAPSDPPDIIFPEPSDHATTPLQRPSRGGEGVIPPTKIVLVPSVSFTILLFLPGIFPNSVYVDAEGDRRVTIGGTWCSGHITCPRSLQDNADGSTSSPATCSSCQLSVPDVVGTPLARPADGRAGGTPQPVTSGPRHRRSGGVDVDEPCILLDTLPQGDFELRIRIPEPFQPSNWYSEYDMGVLFVVWELCTLP